MGRRGAGNPDISVLFFFYQGKTSWHTGLAEGNRKQFFTNTQDPTGYVSHHQSCLISFYAPHFALYSSPNGVYSLGESHYSLFKRFSLLSLPGQFLPIVQKPSLAAPLTSWDPHTAPPLDTRNPPLSCNCVCMNICLPRPKRPDIPPTVEIEAKVPWTPCPQTRH